MMHFQWRAVPTSADITEDMVLNAIHELASLGDLKATRVQVWNTVILRCLCGILPRPFQYFTRIVDSQMLKLLEKGKITLLRDQDMPTNRDLVKYEPTSYQTPITRIGLYLPSEEYRNALQKMECLSHLRREVGLTSFLSLQINPP
ncbi:hypothetical protein KP509_32G031000 [Ceratopteris richardii]|uniref:Uncharacterized protein n=1 Tax=Ceratopteris richardii TaxID=49495 RepID=A0A8T2QTQ7_CERRI|nr:hypothetical protein KP509_32G031000 [Ceratopteris richardii]KAH7286976.1 hypothetical protein KP509_32G031000 [Ceratopteris richardii]